MESSYNYHINRRSVKITYKCRHCGVIKIFFNRCNLLSHIRSHAFKTATINVSDLKVEPLPIDFFPKIIDDISEKESKNRSSRINNKPLKVQLANSTCYECKMDNTNTGIAYKDRAKHYMQYSKALHSCPICMFNLPTICALKAHLRLHLKTPPFYCPECGVNLPNKSIQYPYAHDCEGFKMMRVTARLICSKECCQVFHPNEYNQHVKLLHLEKIYKCPVCAVACFNENSIQNHLKCHSYDTKAIVFYQCKKCSGKLVLQSQIDNHLRTHVNYYAYPCWKCGTIFKDVSILINHHMEKHLQEINITKQWYVSILNEKKKEYNGIKKHSTYSSSLKFKAKKNKSKTRHNKTSQINKLQPNKLIKQHITCHLCKNKISQNWKIIKKHYANYHKDYKCVDVRIDLNKLSTKRIELENCNNFQYKPMNHPNVKSCYKQNETSTNLTINSHSQPKTAKNELTCPKCKQNSENKESLELHMTCHRDPYMAYQCLECGQSFAVKPSFSTHLLVEHEISDVTDYINKKQCYNDNALVKYMSRSEDEEPIKENQCQICRDQFANSNDLQKHFRGHGMAFLLKNTNKLSA